MRPRTSYSEVALVWLWAGLTIGLVCGMFLGVLTLCGCGTESHQSAQSVAVTPAPLSTPALPGHTVREHTYRVCAGPGLVQEITQRVETGPVSEDWPAAEVPCVESAPDQEGCR